jgi:hypothetical protein
MRLAGLALVIMAAALAPGARAQIRLPVTVPSLPLPNVSQTLEQTESRALDTAGEIRRQAITRLLKNKLIETDPDGNPIVRGELVAVGLDETTLARLRALGYAVDRESVAADMHIVVLKVPAGRDTKRALRELEAAGRGEIYAYNHIYLGVGTPESGSGAQEAVQGAPRPPAANPAPPSDTSATDSRSVAPASQAHALRVGLVDSGVDVTHPAFRDASIHPWGCGGRPVADAHGTEVASLLAARGAAEIFAADVYCGAPTGGAVDAIAAALGWLSAQGVAVINVSLVGPRNALLERIVAALIARGHLIVAAVGNDGPAAPPLYPASYPDVVGVTAVDAHRHVLIEAGRGPQVMFAALGAGMQAAGLDHRYLAVRGTSFAAPIVTTLLAALLPSPDRRAAEAAVEALAARAIRMGRGGGKDLTYGYGVVGEENH